MTDNPIIKHLNTILSNELIAISQYFLHARILENQGIKKLGEKIYHFSIHEMKHADTLVKRILALKGLPIFHYPEKLAVGKSVESIIKSDSALEKKAIENLKEAIHYCSSDAVKDYASADMLSLILTDEEEHWEWLNAQLYLLNTMGETGYLQSQI